MVEEFAPSKALLREFVKNKTIGWNEYERKFRGEIKNNPSSFHALNGLKLLSKTSNVTILCHCIDENRCRSFIIKQMTEEG